MKQLSELIGERPGKPVSMDSFPKEVARKLRLQRMAFMWRRPDLAERAGVSVQTVKAVEKGEATSSWDLVRILLALNQGSDFLKMLGSPNFPSLEAHERYVQLTSGKGPSLPGQRSVRSKVPATTNAREQKT